MAVRQVDASTGCARRGRKDRAWRGASASWWSPSACCCRLRAHLQRSSRWEAPLLTSLPFASPVSIHWTPATAGGGGDGGHGHGHGHSGDGGASASVQSVLRAPGPCASPAGPALAIATFADTTTSDFSDAAADGTYCYSIDVTDGTSTADSPGLTVVVDTLPAVAVAPSPPIAPIGGGIVIQPTSVAAGADLSVPAAPTRLSVSVPRSRPGGARVHVTVRWANPVAADLAHVDVVLNSRRPPRDATDGTLAYRGLATSIVLTMRAGQRRYLALFSVDRSGNVSAAARRVVSLASLVPLRPLSGSSVSTAPRLTWKATKGASYYNLQVFRNGKRVLVAWPSRPSYRLPAGTLLPGTYVVRLARAGDHPRRAALRRPDRARHLHLLARAGSSDRCRRRHWRVPPRQVARRRTPRR